MSIFDIKGNLMKDEEGLNIINGSSYKVRIAKTKSRDERVDFTSDDVKGKYLIYPSSVGLTPATESLTKDYVGSPSSESYLGATTYAGDISFGAFVNSNAYYMSLIWANVHTKENTGNIICINCFSDFSIKMHKNENTVTMLEIIREDENGFYSDFIDIYDSMTQQELIDTINNIKNIKSFLITGDKNDTVDFTNFLGEFEEEDNYLISFKRVGFIESGVFSEEAKKLYPRFVNIISPRFGETQYYNLALFDSSKNIEGIQYIGCESKSMSFNFANKALTQITSSLWASGEHTLDKDSILKEERAEERDVVMAQTSKYPTKLFINGTEATSVSDIAIAFEWTKEEKFNVSAKRYNFPNNKFTLTFSGNAVFNTQSKELFYNRILNGDRQSFVIYSKTKFRGKDYPFIFVSADVSGSPSFPTIESKDISVSLNNFKASEDSIEMKNNYLIAFTDRVELF